MSLSDKERDFLIRYFHTSKIEKSYVQAKLPSDNAKDAKTKALALLDRQESKDFLEDLEIEVREASRIESHKIIGQYKAIAYSDITDVVSIHENYLQVRELQHLSDDTKSAIKELSMSKNGIKVVMYDKMAALSQLARISGLTDNFDTAVQTLARYGIILNCDEEGKWSVVNGSSDQDDS